MPERRLTLQTPKNPPTLRADRTVLAGGQASSPARKAASQGDTFTAIGYRQTNEPAARGGKMQNSHGWRFRPAAMRALARSFRGQPFITAHDFGDARSRGGTIVDAYVEEIAETAETAIVFDIVAQSDWAKAGLANGTIDRFSIGAEKDGEITCTVHGAPVFTECDCFPGELVTVKVDDADVELIAEWEFEDGSGRELSAVNVPAVDGTGIVDATRDAGPVAAADRAASLEALCGRPRPRFSGGAPKGGFPRATSARTMTITAEPRPTENQMDPREQMAKALGLPVDATWEQILAKQAQVTASAAQTEVARASLVQSSTELAAERARTAELAAAGDRAHVEAEITRVRSTRLLSDEVVASLRASAAASRATFDASLHLTELAAQPIAAPQTRIALQSEAPPARDPATAATAQPDPDAFEQHQHNPSLPLLMKACKIGPDDVRKHGPKAIAVIHNLGELITATDARSA